MKFGFYKTLSGYYAVKEISMENEKAIMVKKAFQKANVPFSMTKNMSGVYMILNDIQYTKEQAKLVINNLNELLKEKHNKPI